MWPDRVSNPGPPTYESDVTVLVCIETLLFMNWIFSTLGCNELFNTSKIPVL